MDFSFLYDPHANYSLSATTWSIIAWTTVFYDLLASEARLGSFVAIAQARSDKNTGSRWDVSSRQPAGTGAVELERIDVLSSSCRCWSCQTYENTLLDQTYRAVVRRQIAYGRQRGCAMGNLRIRLQHHRPASIISIARSVCPVLDSNAALRMIWSSPPMRPPWH